MSDAIQYDHDAEARRSTLKVWPERLEKYAAVGIVLGRTISDHGTGALVTVDMTDDEAIALYRLLASHWAGYVAEMDEARAAVARGVTLNQYIGDWRAEQEDNLRDLGGDPFDDLAAAADHARKAERENR